MATFKIPSELYILYTQQNGRRVSKEFLRKQREDEARPFISKNPNINGKKTKKYTNA